jgi:hypothetical protein
VTKTENDEGRPEAAFAFCVTGVLPGGSLVR